MFDRKNSAIGLATILGICALATVAMAQQPQQAPPLMVHDLKKDMYWIEGGGGNTGVIVGKTSVIVVDTKTTAAAGKEILADIAKITPKPVTHVILTHSDGDHVNGLASFPMGLTIIAQENCKKEEEASIAAGGRGAAPKDYLPNHTYDKKESLTIDGIRVQLLHYGPSHTTGDTVVYFPDQKVLFGGDILATTSVNPIIHLEKNGSASGWITTVKEIVKLDTDTIVPGHGPIQTKDAVRKKLADVEQKSEKVKGMVAEGKSLDEVKQATGEGTSPFPFAMFAEARYKELAKK